MLAASVTELDPTGAMAGLTVGSVPDPEPGDGWVRVKVNAASLNHHDLWSLKGVGLPAERLPMILGCDAAGVTDDGREVIVHAVIGDPDAGGGDETLDPRRSLLSEVHPGTLAEYVCVPARNLVDKPAAMSFVEASCLPTAWLTAYRMLTTRGDLRAGETVLVQGVGGGVSTAAIALAKAMGARVWATSRDAGKRQAAVAFGADEAFESGARLPDRVDLVIESVGDATWSHSLKSLRPGGRIVVCGATTGPNPPADLARVFFLQLSVVGSTMGTLRELESLADFMANTGIAPTIAHTLPLDDAREGLSLLDGGTEVGKIVLAVA
jgi:NADPH:quinone reductase-like Zn-dependent oxidoreductase